LTEPSQSQLILHPLRLRILRTLGEHELTPKMLQERLADVAPATLYRHLKILEAAALIQVIREESKRGTIEKTYVLAQGSLLEGDLLRASLSEWQTLFQRFSTHLIADFDRYLKGSNPQPLQDGVGFRQALLYLSPAELKRLTEELRAVLSSYLKQEPTPERRGITLATILIPEPLNESLDKP
jgi:DNA-binding transcriptional ArsR family regulator